MSIHFMASYASPGGLVVRVLRCGLKNPGSNPGLDRLLLANALMEKEADKQTITNRTDASQIQKHEPKRSCANGKTTEIQQIVQKIRSKLLHEKFVQCIIISWVPRPVRMVYCSGHCVVAAVTQIRRLVWTYNFLLNRFQEEEAHTHRP